MTPDAAREFVKRMQWTYAASVPDAPHSYVVRDNLTPDLQDDFDAFVGFIARTGFVSRFRGTRYVYVEIGEFRYWQSRSLFQTGSNLNRVRLEDVVEDDQLSLGGL